MVGLGSPQFQPLAWTGLHFHDALAVPSEFGCVRRVAAGENGVFPGALDPQGAAGGGEDLDRADDASREVRRYEEASLPRATAGSFNNYPPAPKV